MVVTAILSLIQPIEIVRGKKKEEQKKKKNCYDYTFLFIGDIIYTVHSLLLASEKAWIQYFLLNQNYDTLYLRERIESLSNDSISYYEHPLQWRTQNP